MTVGSQVQKVTQGTLNAIGPTPDRQSRLTDLKPETIAVLKAAGFELLTDVPAINAVIVTVAIEKIAALGEFDQVTYISPQLK